MPATQEETNVSTTDDQIIVTAGEWILNLCSGKGSLDEDKLLTRLEQVKLDEFFNHYGQSPVFKYYYVESVRQCLSKEPKPEYQLVRTLLEMDVSRTLFVKEDDVLQVAIKAARVAPVYLGKDPAKSCPELFDMVKLLMAHGASVQCLDDNGYSPLSYACVLGYEELFRFLIASGADTSTIHKRITPAQVVKERDATESSPGDEQDEQINLLKVTLDALISPENIVDMTWVSWPPGVDFDGPLWDLDVEATWGGIILYLLEQGLSYAKHDPGLVMLLHIACYIGSANCAEKLLNYGVATDIAGPQMVEGGQGRTSTFGTAMHAAAAGRNLSIISKLISRGESSNLQRPCIFNRGSIKGDFTPVEISIQATGDESQDDFLNFVQGFLSQAKDLEKSDYEPVLASCVEMDILDYAKNLLEQGVRLPEVPTGVRSVEMVQLLVSYGIDLDAAALQRKVLRIGRLDLLRWCVNEYGPLLPSDPKSWGEIAQNLLRYSFKNLDDLKYLITEYPGPHIDSVLIPKVGPRSGEKKALKTSWLDLALVEDNIKAIRFILDAGADPTCPGLPHDARDRLRKNGRDSFRTTIVKRLDIVQILEKRFSKDDNWSIPSYADTRYRIAQAVERQKLAWEGHVDNVLRHRQDIPHVSQKRNAHTSLSSQESAVGLYLPLGSSSSFRLLELQPSSNAMEPLVGRLINSDITFQPDYEALSYAWGDCADVNYIKIDDCDIAITPNLHLALIHLRATDNVRVLWIDALCINQSVHGERNQQVRIMGDIYKSARQVIVWLGEAADDSHLVFEHLKDSLDESLDDSPVVTESKRRAWNALVKRPWFFRTWVIQEISLARRAVIMCGKDSTLWRNLEQGWKEDFSSGANGLSSVRTAPGNKPDHPLTGFDPDEHVWRLRLLEFGSDPISILRYSRVCQTSEIRDRIYGILGLFEPGFIVVDYDLAVEDIFTQFTEGVIRRTGNLRILEHLGVERTYKDLPSWVPDFTDCSTLSLPGRSWYPGYGKDPFNIRTADGEQFDIPRQDLTAKHLPGLAFMGDGRLLIRGKMIDTIKDVGPELPIGITYAPGTEQFAHVMKKWESLAATLILTWDSSLESSVTSMYASTISAANESDLLNIQVGFTQWYRLCGAGILESSDPSMLLRNNEFYLWWLSQGTCDTEDSDRDEEDSEDDTEKIGYDLREFAEKMAFASYGHCLFTTEAGSMGLTSPRARAGDKIVYFPGADEPFVLRKEDDRKGWKLVNDCHLHGLDLEKLFENSEHLVEDFVISRIRTPTEPPSAAWNVDGANYPGFHGWPDEPGDCQECTTVDRTPEDPHFFQLEHFAWPESDDEDDPDWLPEDQDLSEIDIFEYDSGSEHAESEGSQRESHQVSDSNIDEESRSQGERHLEINTADKYPLTQLHQPEWPERLPHGTWHSRRVYYTGDRESVQRGFFPEADGKPYVPTEHVAAPSCRSLLGINGNVLSVQQMKNCRNVRFLIPKPPGWQAEETDEVFEKDSKFCISGESNGSTLTVHKNFQSWRSFYPPRHGIHELSTSWEFVDYGCYDSDMLFPLPVHSYCLDMYAKASYQRLGRVNLDGLWYWRDEHGRVMSNPSAYGLDYELKRKPEAVMKAREDYHMQWKNFPGDEWLAANPVEIPFVDQVMDSCATTINEAPRQASDTGMLTLPNELLSQIMSYFGLNDLNAVALTCHRMHQQSQSIFKEHVIRDMPWLWELRDGTAYPISPDRPVTWDPLCPLGFMPPELPPGLQREGAETALWKQITDEFPEMEEVGETVKAINCQRREEILAPYQAKEKSLLQEWHVFRSSVAGWITQRARDDISEASVDWRRLWRFFHPATTKLHGIRNRALIWERCELILHCIATAHEKGVIADIDAILHERLLDPSYQAWRTDLQIDD
ncbi:heterokaryon incompatibility protein het-6 [Fusarium heterosporum]|uniref:Heterokaryon incompatibility protein het-6 n=1 Tax=Fusarium heterosporum TaxID=42747 RepID=A0A8H5X2V5_FUSHE|nr:heterokaryon incompatibility protein het-6 [Fusarium heterosporum]